MQELIVFVHGMVNFSHNRTKQDVAEKEAQERLIRDQVGSHHSFLGAFDDSGNFAFRTEYEPVRLKADVLAILNQEYKVKGAVVVERCRTQKVLRDVTKLCSQMYSKDGVSGNCLVWKDSQPWRLGMVFVEELYEKHISYIEELVNLQDDLIEILTLQDGFVGLLKFDPETPRIPWGEPAKTVEKILASLGAKWLATGRSARTVNGVLRKFSHQSYK
jgi:hypothetical protein